MIPAVIAVLTLGSHAGVPMDAGLESGASSLIINEFMVLPDHSSTQLTGQWVEIYNNSRDWVNLGGWSLVNHRGDTHVFPAYMLPPEGYYVLGASGSPSENGGYTPNGVWSNFRLARYGELTLYSPSHAYSDRVNWNHSWPVVNGASCERINPGWEPGLPSSWASSLHTYGNGDLGTPGAQNSVFTNSFVQNSWAYIKAFIN